MTLAQIKALFKTGAIPTQADFENLIDKIPNSDKPGIGDNTLSFVDPSHVKVLGYRFVTIGDESSYIFIGLYDAANAAYIPYIILRCESGSPSEYIGTPPVEYTILTSEQMLSMFKKTDDMHSATDEAIVGAIPLDAKWWRISYTELNATHRMIKKPLCEEHFFKFGNGLINIYFKIIDFDETNTYPIVTEATQINVIAGTSTNYKYFLKSGIKFNEYKTKLNSILHSTNTTDSEVLSFIHTYMKDINATSATS